MRGPRDGQVVLLAESDVRRQRRTPQPAPRPSDTAASLRGSCGVTAQVRPSKRSAAAASGPERSLPAIGWPPTYRGSSRGVVIARGAAASARAPRFTLPTSVTTAAGYDAQRRARSRRRGGRAASRPPRATRMRRRVRRCCRRAREEATAALSGSTSSTCTLNPASASAIATDVPIRPAPTTSTGPARAQARRSPYPLAHRPTASSNVPSSCRVSSRT